MVLYGMFSQPYFQYHVQARAYARSHLSLTQAAPSDAVTQYNALSYSIVAIMPCFTLCSNTLDVSVKLLHEL